MIQDPLSGANRSMEKVQGGISTDLSLSIIQHPFRLDQRETLPIPFVTGISLLELRSRYFPADLPVLIYLNGKLVPLELWNITCPKPGDFVLFTAALSGGGSGGKNLFRSILMLGVALVASWAAPGLAAALGFAGNTIATGLIAAGLTMVGGLIVNALLPPATAKPTYDSALDSQCYSWSPQNTEQQGIPVAKWYGLHKIYGNVICSYIENQGQTQILNALVCPGLGPIKSLANFKINDQPCQNFQQVEVKTRYGYLHQEAIEGFQNTKVEYPSSVEILNGTPYVYETVGSEFDMLEVDVSFPTGLWEADNEAKLKTRSVDVRIEVRKLGEADWQNITMYPEHTYSFRDYGAGLLPSVWSRGKWIVADSRAYWWNVESGSANYADHKEGDPADGGTTWHWLGPVPQLYRKNDDSADFVERVVENFTQPAVDYVRVTEAKSTVLRYTYPYTLAPGQKGKYEIRVTRLTGNANSTTIGDRSFFSGVREILTDNFQYPRHVLVAIRATATDQLSGSLRFSCTGEMSIVQIWDGMPNQAGTGKVHTFGSSTSVSVIGGDFSAVSVGDEIIAGGQSHRVVGKIGDLIEVHAPVDWENGGQGLPWELRHWILDWSDNPAWVTLDILTQPVIGGQGTEAAPFYVVRFDGLDTARIDLPKFKEWADFCDELVPDGNGGQEKRVTFNGGFDFDTSMWEAALRVCQVGRATPVWNGIYLTLAIDKPADPVNLYSVGNIEESKFKEVFLPLEERATQIEIDYTNQENDYQRDKLTVYRPDVSNGQYKASLDLFGITKPSEAWRAGMYRLMCNRYLVRSAEIDVDIEALNAQIGDVVYIQHDVPRWGSGGRIVSATANTVTLDKEVTLESGLSYKILVRLSDDTVQEALITDEPGTYTTLHLATNFDPVPQQYDVYAFGQVNSLARQFRITDISKSQDQKVTLSLIEYRPEIYDFEELAPPSNDFSQTALKRMEPRDVKLSQTRIMGPEGRTSAGIALTFTKSADPAYRQCEVWFAAESGSDRTRWEWIFAGATSGTSFEITGVEYQRKYAVILIPADSDGNKLYHGSATLNEITIEAPTRAAEIFYGSASGKANLHTSGTSTTVTTTGNAFESVLIGCRLTADSQVRTIAEKIDANTVRVDYEVNWDNNGAGHPFTYDASVGSLMPADPGATNGAVIGSNLFLPDELTLALEGDILNSSLTPTIQQAQADIESAREALSDLQTEAADHEGRLQATESNVTTLQGQIVLKASQGTVEDLSGRMTTAEQDIDGLQGQIVLKASQVYVDNIKIGGRNLVPNGSALKGTTGWVTSGLAIGRETLGNVTAFYYTSNTEWERFLFPPRIKIKPGVKYTLRFLYKCSANVQSVDCYVLGTNDPNASGEAFIYERMAGNYIQTSSLTETVYSFVTEADECSLYLRFDLNGVTDPPNIGTVWIAECKLEEGDKATSWTPAPEDIDGDISSLGGRVTAAEVDIDGLQGEISLKAYGVGAGGNLLQNPDFYRGSFAGWEPLLLGAMNIGLGIDLNSNWKAFGIPTPFIYQSDGATSTPEVYFITDRMPIKAGSSYGFSIYTGCHNCKADVYIEFLDTNDQWCGGAYSGPSTTNDMEMTGGPLLSNYKRIWVAGTAPANAVRVYCVLRKYATAVSNYSYVFFCRAQLEEWAQGQPGPAPWTGTANSQASSAQIDIDGIKSEVTIKVDNNGNIAGMGLIAGPTSSEFMVLANKFMVKNPANSAQPGKIPFVVGTVNGQSVVGISGDLLVDGSIQGRSLAASNIITTSAQIASAIIQDGHIQNISAGKISAGSIDAGQVTIVSPDGKTRFSGNRIEVYDENNRLRVRLGALS